MTLKTIIKEWLTPGLLIGAIIGGAVFFGELKGLIFGSEEQRIKTKNHINTPINEVTVFRQSDTLSKRSDTLIQQQKQLEELVIRQNSLLDSITSLRVKRDIKDSVDEIKKIKSRNAREAKMDYIINALDSLKQ